MKLRLYALLTACTLLLGGCTSVEVRKASPSLQMTHLCIQQDPSVTVPDFVSVLRDGISRNGLTSEVFAGNKPAHCAFVLTYTARRSWDLATYLSQAELRIENAGRIVASAEYRLRGKGGLSLTKWASVKSKMDPVIDELLASHRRPVTADTASVPPAAAIPQPEPATLSNDAQPPASPVAPAGSTAQTPSAPDTGAFGYTGSPESAARALATARNCSSGFRLYSSEENRSVYTSTCWGAKKLLIACESGACREMR